MADLDPNALQKLRVVDLKEKLSARGLSTSGLKADLVKRLRGALLSEAQLCEEKNDEPEEPCVSEENLEGDADEEHQLSSDEGTEEHQMDISSGFEPSEDTDVEMKMVGEESRDWSELQANDEPELEEENDVNREEIIRWQKQQEREAEEKRWEEQEEREAEEKRWKEQQEREAEERRWKEEQEREAEERKWKEQQEREAEERRWKEQQEREAEERRWKEQQEREAEEQSRIKAEEKQRLRAEEEKKRQTEEEQRRQAEEQRRLAEEEAEMQRIKVEQENRQKAEQERLRIEKQLRQRQIEEEKLMLAKEQQKMLAEEQKRQLAEAEKLRLAEEQQRLLAEEKEKLAEQQQRMLAEERRRLLAEEQQRLLAEEERQKETELFQLQQQALIEKDEEQRTQTILLPPPAPVAFPPGLHIPPPPTTAPTVQSLPSGSQQIPQGLQMSHVLTVPSQPPASSHVQLHPPPPPPSLSTIGALPPPPPPALLVPSVQQRAPPPPPGPMPPPSVSASTTNMSHPLAPMSITSLSSGAQLSHFSQPPPPPAISGTMISTSVPPPVSGTMLSTSLPPPPGSGTMLTASIPPPPPPGSGSMLTTSIPPPPPPGSGSMLSTSLPPPPGSGSMLTTSMPPPPPGSGSMLTTSMPPPPPGSGSMLTTSMPPPPPGSGTLLTASMSQSALATSVTLQSSQPTSTLVSSLADSTSEMDTTPSSSATLGATTAASDGNLDIDESIKLPQAVEKVFALKTKRAQQLGVDPDAVVTPSVEKDPQTQPLVKAAPVTLVAVDELDEDEDMEEEESSKKPKESKSRRRKKKKKKAKHSTSQASNDAEISSSKERSVDIDIEYVQDVLDPSDPLYNQFIKIFEKFKLNEPEKDKADVLTDVSKEEMQPNTSKVVDRKKPADLDDDDDDDEDRDEEKKDEEKPKLSKRKLKKLSRMTVAELKQKVGRPELVEMHDVTAKDPVLLLHLKASRNTVPVPRHWCFKRKYLQGKRGIEKPAFELPDFIKRTGIMEMRQALQEKEDQKTMKAKMRERVRPKLGKIDIDYHKLHDAFFKWQTKPKMTIHGDLYYEGKEFETRLKEKKPGDLSDDLRVALGMPTGPNANKCPPPWLIAMQRYGPPPSYPNLKIPGLNAPIPEGCSFGYHAGGWGKPPVDEMGRPLYGDVFGTQAAENLPQIPEEEIDHTLWGELESESSEEEDDEEEEDEDEEEQKGEDETGLVTPAEGLITPSGFSSIPAGMETPDMIELRKRKTEAEMEGGETPALYTILPEKKSDRIGAAMMGSTHIYDLSAAIPASKVKASGTTSVPPQGIEVALDPSELEMDTAAMAARYEQTMREQSQLEKEDLSDMVAEHAARQKTKRKKQQQDSGKAPKKYKEFKF